MIINVNVVRRIIGLRSIDVQLNLELVIPGCLVTAQLIFAHKGFLLKMNSLCLCILTTDTNFVVESSIERYQLMFWTSILSNPPL